MLLLDYVSLHGKRNFVDVIKVTNQLTLRLEIVHVGLI